MALYKYIAVNTDNPPHEMIIEAENKNEALSKLRASGLRPVRFCGEVDSESRGSFFSKSNKVDVFDFTSQLAPLLTANIPLERALGIIADSSSNSNQRQFVLNLRQGLHEGKRFSELIRSSGRIFPGYYANLIETGEETGCLPEVTEELLKFLEESKETKDFIVSSSIYPIAVLGVSMLVMILMFTVFVPKFANEFEKMGREIPFSMNFLSAISLVIMHALWVVPLAGILIYVVLKWYYGKERLRERWNNFQTKVPILGDLLVEIEMGKFFRTLSILITNHVDIIKTVRISSRVVQNRTIQESFSGVERRLKGGEKLSATLADNEFVPAGTPAKIRVGEETGAVGEMLSRISEHIEKNTKRKVKRLLSLFEPIMIIFLAVIVLIVVISIFMTIMELNQMG